MKKQVTGKLLSVSTGEELDGRDHYDNWAEDYDTELLNDYGYTGHLQVAQELRRLTNEDEAAIIDLGCGTGLLGRELAKLGFSCIDGVDFSKRMLEKAKPLGSYQQLFEMDLTQSTRLADDHYDYAVSAGVFGAGHLHARHIREFIRVTRSGGKIIIMMNAMPYEEDDYEAEFVRIASEGLWTVESNQPVNYMDKLDRPGRLIIATCL